MADLAKLPQQTLSRLQKLRRVMMAGWTDPRGLAVVVHELIAAGVVSADALAALSEDAPADRVDAVLLRLETEARQVMARVITGDPNATVEYLARSGVPGFVAWGATEHVPGEDHRLSGARVTRSVEVVPGVMRPARALHVAEFNAAASVRELSEGIAAPAIVARGQAHPGGDALGAEARQARVEAQRALPVPASLDLGPFAGMISRALKAGTPKLARKVRKKACKKARKR